jgi:hypothetical protein
LWVISGATICFLSRTPALDEYASSPNFRNF